MAKAAEVLIIGSGGREHAMGEKLKHPSRELFFAPGNAGTAALGTNVDIDPTDIEELVRFASDRSMDLTVVGPEAPLAQGLVNAFNEEILPTFGPTREAARLETDKAWATRFMARHNIPHPKSETFSDPEDAKRYLAQGNIKNRVIKASGLAGGKGVFLPDSYEEVQITLNDLMREKIFGIAGETIVIQERLSGPELSVLAFSDGTTVVPLLPARDHKRIFDGDKGPNTGGMGAYAPVEVDAGTLKIIHRDILQKTIDGMKEGGTPFKGVLYAGLMLTHDGPKVLEFNARFGDPETQPLMMLLDSDLGAIMKASISGNLKPNLVKFCRGTAVCVVLAAKGYPGSYEKGVLVEGLDRIKQDNNLRIFHAGTIHKEGGTYTSGGRVLGVTAWGNTHDEALTRVYSVIGENGVHFAGMQYRRDIGKTR